MTKTSRSIAAFVAGLIVAVAMAAPAVADPFPPQLPTPAEMAALQAQMKSALDRVRATQGQLDKVIAEYERANDRLTELAGQISVSQEQQNQLDAELRASQATIDSRAEAVYKSERIGMVDALLSARTFREFITVVGLFQSISTHDAQEVLRVRGLRSEAAKSRTQLEDQKAAQIQLTKELAVQEKQVERSLSAASKDFAAVQAEFAKRKSGWAFPVKGAYSYTDTYGAPRMEGTKYYHRHEGTDIFALKGTPIVAVVDGVIENVGTATLGGIKLWVRSPGDNWTYYYAHLTSYAPGVANGVRVHKGDIVGYVGNTGNAQGTPPHLHFETHVPSGPPTNPYPILRRADPLVK